MAKKSNFQINLEYYAAWIILKFLGVLPRRLALFIGLRFGDIAYFLLGKLKRTALKNTAIAFPEMAESERKKLVRGNFQNLGRQLVEVSQFPKATRESLENIFELSVGDDKWEKYEEIKKSGRGLIFITPHFGGWEVLAFVSFIFLGPQSYLVRKLDNPRLEKMLAAIRGKFGNQPLDKSTGILPALELLRAGGNLGILPDLNTQRHEGVFVPFFGKDACTTAGVAALAMRTNAIVGLLSAAWDEKKKKYVITVDADFELESSGNRKQDMIDFTARFTKEIENVIRRHPEQWFWIHRRWKTRPKGEPEIY
ncbi:MAG: lysophospholipid acyltransferase family protein [Pyrinomonadaceae bacterium]